MRKFDIFLKNKYFFGILSFIAFFLFNYFIYRHFLSHFFYSDDYFWLRYGELAKENIWNIFRMHVTSFFSPVTNTYFFLGQTFFPFQVESYHFSGIVLHSINTWLVFLLLHKLLKNYFSSLAGALYFAVSLYHYEAIIWISSIMHVLVTLFVLLGLLSFLKYHESKKIVFLFLSVLAGGVAFFTKENGIIFVPAVFGLALFLERKNIFTKEKFLFLFPYILLLLGLLFYTYNAQKNSMWIQNGVYNINPKAIYPLFASLIGLFDMNSANLLVPHPWWIFGIILLFLSVTFLFWYKYRNEEGSVFVLGLFISLFAFVPVMFFYFGTWRQISQHRYAYLPSIGSALMVAAFVGLLWKKCLQQKVCQIVFLGLCVWYLGYNIQDNYHQYTRDYQIVDKQARGMLMSFRELESELTSAKNIVLVAPFPFFGNEYYRYMYQYFVAQEKDLEDWRSIRSKQDVDISRETSRGKPLFLMWDNKHMKFQIEL